MFIVVCSIFYQSSLGFLSIFFFFKLVNMECIVKFSNIRFNVEQDHVTNIQPQQALIQIISFINSIFKIDRNLFDGNHSKSFKND